MIAQRGSSFPRECLAAAIVALGLGACAGVEQGDSQRRARVYVPASAQPVDRVRWDDMRNIRPLNERMILFDVRRRPHLLVLAETCVGLRRGSMLVVRRETSHFNPQRDAIGFLNPGTVASARTCVPDTLYAIDDEGVDELKALL